MTEVVQGTPEPKRMVKVFRLKAVEEWCGLKASRIWDLVKASFRNQSA
jgi:predicted DNA-binding transcriptional regulator AlpA